MLWRKIYSLKCFGNISFFQSHFGQLQIYLLLPMGLWDISRCLPRMLCVLLVCDLLLISFASNKMNVLFEFYPYLSDVKTSIVCENKLMIKRSRV